MYLQYTIHSKVHTAAQNLSAMTKNVFLTYLAGVQLR